MYTDNYVKIGYNPVSGIESWPINHIGPGGHYLIEEKTHNDTDANTIYVNDTTGNDTTGTGTSALPYKTLLKGANETTQAKTYVVVQDSATYTEDLSTMSTSYIIGFFADTGQTPYYNMRSLGYTPADANSIFVSKSGLDTNAGTQAAPKLTLTGATGAISAIDATHNNIVILDSGEYDELAFEMTGNFTGLYADILQTPTINFTEYNVYSDYTATMQDVGTFVVENGIFAGARRSMATLSGGNVACSYQETDFRPYLEIFGRDGAQVLAKTVYNGSTQGYPTGACRIGDNRFIQFYYSAASGGIYNYAIYDSTGNQLYNDTNNNNTLGARLEDGNAVLIDNQTGGFRTTIIDQENNTISGPTTVKATAGNAGYIAPLSGGQYAAVYGILLTTPVYAQIYNADGTLSVSEFQLSAAGSHYLKGACQLDDDKFFVVYTKQADSKPYYAIFDNTGASVKAETLLVNLTTITDYTQPAMLTDKSVVIGYESAGNYYLYAIDQSGNVKYGPTATTTDDYGILSKFDDGAVALHEGTTSRHSLTYFHMYNMAGVKVSAVSTINGMTLNGNNSTNLDRLIWANGVKPTIKWCDLYGSTSTSTTASETYYGAGLRGDNDTEFKYNIVRDCSGGIDLTTNTVTLEDNAIYRCENNDAIHIDGAAAGAGDITVEHMTLFQNYSGLYLENNNGTNEVVKNNIFHDCTNYDIKTTNGQTFTNTVHTGTLTNATAGTQVLTSNPLFVNEGAITPSDINLQIKVTELGYPTNSPAKSLADDSRDAGCYIVYYIGESEQYTYFTIEKPGEIKRKIIPIGDQENQKLDGDYESSVEGFNEEVTFEWEGVLNADHDNLIQMLLCGNNKVRVYWDPVTYQYTYQTFKIKYDDLSNSTKHFLLTRTGRSDVELTLKRRYSLT